MDDKIYKTNAKKITFMLSYMTKGSALTWATTFCQTVLAITSLACTWTDFEAKFKQTFELSNAVTTLIQWLSIHYLQENASTVEVATYVSEFKNHTQISGTTANITLIGYFSVGILIKLMKQIYSMVLQYGWIPILFPLYMTHMRPSDKSSRKNGMISHMITPRLIHFSFHYLVNDSLSWTELRSRSADLYL